MAVTIEVIWEDGETATYQLSELEWRIAMKQAKEQNWVLFFDTLEHIHQLNLMEIKSITKVA